MTTLTSTFPTLIPASFFLLLWALQRYSLFAHRKISTTNSSVGEIRLKENCERLMDKLEKDINRLSIPAPIYISDS